MTREMLKEFSGAQGWKWMEDSILGVCQDYPFVTRWSEQGDSVLTTVFTTVGRLPKGKALRLRKALPPGCFLALRTSLVLSCSGKGEELLEAHAEAMEMVASALREAGIGVPDRCPLCRKRGCDSLALLGEAYTPVHWACCQGKQTFTVSRGRGAAGSYAAGILGAILGGAAASVPAVLAAQFMRVFAFLFLLIPLGSYFGYWLCRGRMNRAAGMVTLVVSLVMPFLVMQAVFYRVVDAASDGTPHLLETVRLYFSLYSPRQIVLAMVIPYLFMLLGLWMILRQMIRSGGREVVDAAGVLDSIIPFRNRE